MLKWNIRNQILSCGVISLLVLFGTVAYFYAFSKGEFYNSSTTLIRMTTEKSITAVLKK